MNRYLWINIDVVHCVVVTADAIAAAASAVATAATVTAAAAYEPINDCGGFDAHWRNYVLAKFPVHKRSINLEAKLKLCALMLGVYA